MEVVAASLDLCVPGSIPKTMIEKESIGGCFRSSRIFNAISSSNLSASVTYIFDFFTETDCVNRYHLPKALTSSIHTHRPTLSDSLQV